MSKNDISAGLDSDSDESSIRRRQVLKAAGTTAVGTAALTGVASGHEGGFGISWVAFCGCDTSSVSLDCVKVEDGEVTWVSYDNPNNCTVLYKAGNAIYKNERGQDIIEKGQQDGACTNEKARGAPGQQKKQNEEGSDPVVSCCNWHSRDPCGCVYANLPLTDGPLDCDVECGESENGIKIDESELKALTRCENCSDC